MKEFDINNGVGKEGFFTYSSSINTVCKGDNIMTYTPIVKSKRKSKIKIGDKFERLTVIEEASRDNGGYILWKCECICGAIKTIRSNHLRTGNTKSCGCLGRDIATKHGMCGTAEHITWAGMLARCNNIHHTYYLNYGERGIVVCARWHNFINFYNDMGQKPEGLTLERVDNNKGYYKENCKWATRSEQGRNRRVAKNSITGITGVRWNKKSQKYIASIGKNNTNIHLGFFNEIKDAIMARKNAEQKYWGIG